MNILIKHFFIVSILLSLTVSLMNCVTLYNYVNDAIKTPPRNFEIRPNRVSFDLDGHSFIFSIFIKERRKIIHYNPIKNKFKVITNQYNFENPVYYNKWKKILAVNAFGGDRNLYTMNSDGSNIKNLTNGDAHYCFYIFSPDEKILYLSKSDYSGRCGYSSKIYKYNMITNEEYLMNENDFTSIRRFSISKNGKYLFFSYCAIDELEKISGYSDSTYINTFTVKKIDTLNNEDMQFLPYRKELINSEDIEIHPDGKTIYAISDRSIRKVNMNGEEIEIVANFKTPLRKDGYSITPDGKKLVYSYIDTIDIKHYGLEGCYDPVDRTSLCFGEINLITGEEGFIKLDKNKILELFKDENPVVQ